MTRRPMRRAVRAIRQAISPRLAMRTDLNMRRPVVAPILARGRRRRLRRWTSGWDRAAWRLRPASPPRGRRRVAGLRLGVGALRQRRLGIHDADRRDGGGRGEIPLLARLDGGDRSHALTGAAGCQRRRRRHGRHDRRLCGRRRVPGRRIARHILFEHLRPADWPSARRCRRPARRPRIARPVQPSRSPAHARRRRSGRARRRGGWRQACGLQAGVAGKCGGVREQLAAARPYRRPRRRRSAARRTPPSRRRSRPPRRRRRRGRRAPSRAQARCGRARHRAQSARRSAAYWSSAHTVDQRR